MPDWLINLVAAVVLVTITALLIGSLVVHIRRERRTNDVRRIWANFGLSIAFCTLFLVKLGIPGPRRVGHVPGRAAGVRGARDGERLLRRVQPVDPGELAV